VCALEKKKSDATPMTDVAPDEEDTRRETAIADYKRKLLAHAEADARARGLRETVRALRTAHDKTEDDLKALQSVGQIIGEVLRQLDEERCALCGGVCEGVAGPVRARAHARKKKKTAIGALSRTSRCPPHKTRSVIVKASSGPRYVVCCRFKLDKASLTPGTRVTLDMTTLTIMRSLKREVRSFFCFSFPCSCSTHPNHHHDALPLPRHAHARRLHHLPHPHHPLHTRSTPSSTTWLPKTRAPSITRP